MGGSASAQGEPEAPINFCINAPTVCQVIQSIDNLLFGVDAADDGVTLPDVWTIATITNSATGGDCDLYYSDPVKDGKYTVSVSGYTFCGHDHKRVAIGVVLQVKRGGAWKDIGAPSQSSDKDTNYSGEATSTGTCAPDTSRRYRAYLAGGSEDGAKHGPTPASDKITCNSVLDTLIDPVP